ncbi:MAG TPA: TRAP transporter small permease [Candidatus Methylomirabilis sp.]|nr:TRAP transporter small permease [Candidatus Methylomirabilis sp.]
MTEPAIPYVRNGTWMAKLEFYLTRTESIVAISGLALLVLLSLAEISARNFFHTAIPGADVLDRYLVVWVSFLGAVLAVRERHIKIDAVAVWLSEAWRRRLERPIFLFSAVVCGALFWAAVRFWREEWAYAAAAEKWITGLGIIIPLSFFLLAFHFSLRFLIGPRSANRAP